jgi:hypothetical protein
MIERDWTRTLKAAAIAVAIGLLGLLFIGQRGLGFKLLGATVLLPALYFAWRAVFASAVGRCPACRQEIEGLSTGDNEALLCPCCFKYVESKAGALSLVPEDRLAPGPLFVTALPQRVRWPEGCAVCGAPATREVAAKRVTREKAPLGRQVVVSAASLGTMRAYTEVTTTVQVPHCGAHDDGAVLKSPGFDADEAEHFIVFRSLRYLRSFCAANGTRPR